MVVAETNQQQLVTDLHLHTENIYRGWRPYEKVPYTTTEAVTQAAQLKEEAIASGASPEKILGGFALTGHDTLRGVSDAMEAGEEHGIVVTPGVEITCKPGKHGPTGKHLVVLMPVEVALGLEGRLWALPTPTLHGCGYVIEWAHDLGCVVIAAHVRPKGNSTSLSYKKIMKHALNKNPARRLDGMETIFAGGLNEADNLDALAEKYKLAKIGASDAHSLKHIGRAATRIWGLPEAFTSDDLLVAIRARNTEPVLIRQSKSMYQDKSPIASLLGQRFGRDDGDEEDQPHTLERMAA
jgi:predicted metal-dependent phosphoesterase TrpH